jgi:hypothetical protein
MANETQRVHVGHWGTYVRARDVSSSSATIDVDVTIENDSTQRQTATVFTRLYGVSADGERMGDAVATIEPADVTVAPRSNVTVKGAVVMANPRPDVPLSADGSRGPAASATPRRPRMPWRPSICGRRIDAGDRQRTLDNGDEVWEFAAPGYLIPMRITSSGLPLVFFVSCFAPRPMNSTSPRFQWILALPSTLTDTPSLSPRAMTT